MLSDARSLDRPLVMAMPAARDMEVGMEFAPGVRPPRLVTLMIRPPPALRISGTDCWMSRTAPQTLSSKSDSQSSWLTCSKLLGHGDAGVVDQNVQPAEPVDGRPHDLVGAVGLRHVGRQRHDDSLGGGPDLFGSLVQNILPPGHDHHVRAFLGHAEGRRLPDTVTAAGDNGDFILESQVHSSSQKHRPNAQATVL